MTNFQRFNLLHNLPCPADASPDFRVGWRHAGVAIARGDARMGPTCKGAEKLAGWTARMAVFAETNL